MASVSTGMELPTRNRCSSRREDSTPLREHAAGPEPEEAENQAADAHPLEGRYESRRPYGRKVAGRLLEPHRNQQGAKHSAKVVATTADDHGREQDQRFRVEPRRWRPRRDEADKDGAAQSGDRSTQDEDRHLQRNRILAERVRRNLVLAHGSK